MGQGIVSGVRLVALALLALLPSLSSAQSAPPTGSPLLGVVEVALGRAHTCAVTRTGSVFCWGGNARGELGVGDASATRRTSAVPVRGLDAGVRAIAAGSHHTCALLESGHVRCWGWNAFGQLGNGAPDFEPVPLPVPVADLTDAVAISAGGVHSCALRRSGALVCWGGNASGQLGDGSRIDRHRPTAVQGLPGVAVRLDAGDQHSCAALGNGSVHCWGNNEFGQLGDNSRIDRLQPVPVRGIIGRAVRVATAARASCAVNDGGATFCWGAQVLEGDDGAEGSLVARMVPRLGLGVRDIDAGVFHVCVLTDASQVRCFGDNASGQFGNGGNRDSFAVEDAQGTPPSISAIGVGGDHTCAIGPGGGVLCWGRNNHGQLGIDRTNERLLPTAVATLDSGVAGIGAGSFHSCALTAAGGVKCWGSNNQDQIGDGTDLPRLTAVDVVGLGSGVRALAVGFDHACAITADRRLQCWGANFAAQLGNGGDINSGTPVAVQGLGDTPVTKVTLGGSHGCALLEGGAVRCWGNNGSGEVGDGSTTQRRTAVAVSGLSSGVVDIAAGLAHTCAVLASGGARCWGDNEFGQIGDGSREQRRTPADVSGLSGLIRIAAGARHTCALNSQGGVSCWGSALFGVLLGDGSVDDRAVPGPVPALASGVADLALGGFHSCVRTTAGSMLCWGDNSAGAIGDNSQLPRGVPTPVAGLTRGVTAIDAGFGGQTCAVVDGAAKCWGENQFGQVGDGTLFGEPRPRPVQLNAPRRRVASLAEAPGGLAADVQFDASGRFVVLSSDAASLVDGDGNGSSDVFLLDREQNSLRRVSVDNDGAEISGPSTQPSMSADARLIVFVAPQAAVGKLLNEPASKRRARQKGAGSAVYLANMLTGTTQQVGTTGTAAAEPQIAASGSTIVYTAEVSDPAEGEVGQANVYVVDVSAAGDEVSLSEPECVTCQPAGDGSANADGASGEAVVSEDGEWVAYSTLAKNGVEPKSTCEEPVSEVVLRNMLTGTTTTVSTATDCSGEGSSNPSIDYAGEVVAFESDQPLSADDGNTATDVYVWNADAATSGDAVVLISEGSDGADGNGDSTEPQVSGDGKQVAFVSSASNLDASFADSNDEPDVHTSSTSEADPARLSLSTSGAEADDSSASPALNYDGSDVAFVSAASLLTGSAGSTAVLARDNPQSPSKQSATWWIPSESGWGLTVFDQGNLLAPTWFTYDTDGEPTWFIVAGAFPQADGSYAGEVLRLTGTPFALIDGAATQSATSAGSVSLTYAGEDALTFAYTVDGISQTKSLEKFSFGARGFTCSTSPDSSRADATNYTDLWTGAGVADAGWGLTLFHVDELLVAIWYTYDDDGEAVFFVITTTLQPDGSFTGDVFRQHDGIPFSAIDGDLPSEGSDVIGTARFTFADGGNATFGYTIGGVTQSRGITRLLVGSQAQVCRSEDVIAQ